MAQNPIRFGILGCAKIATKLCRAIHLSPNSIVVAIGSRSIDKASKFATDNALPVTVKLYGTYEAVLDDVDVDAVYLPLPTSLHVRWACLAAQKKKHVLLEKPVALNVKELDVILEACESNGVQFMDGTMWMHHPRTDKMMDFLSDSQRFGQLKAVHSVFSLGADEDFFKNDIRAKPDLDALGALGDVGWYCIRAILWAANYQLPKTVTTSPGAELNEAGVILSCDSSLIWDDGKTARFYCSFLTHFTEDMTVLGTKGTLRVHDFVVPVEENVGTFYAASRSNIAESPLGYELKARECNVVTDLPQDALMVREFASLVCGIKANGGKPEKKWPTISRKTQVVVDAVKESIDRGFKPVEIVY